MAHIQTKLNKPKTESIPIMFTKSGNKFAVMKATTEQKQVVTAAPLAFTCVGNSSPMMAHGIFAIPENKLHTSSSGDVLLSRHHYNLFFSVKLNKVVFDIVWKQYRIFI